MMSRTKRLAADVGRLEERVAHLEEEIQEARAMNRRLADVVDVVTELLVPAMDRDDELVRAAVERFERVVPPADPGTAAFPGP